MKTLSNIHKDYISQGIKRIRLCINDINTETFRPESDAQYLNSKIQIIESNLKLIRSQLHMAPNKYEDIGDEPPVNYGGSV